MIVHGVKLAGDGDMVCQHLRQRGEFEPMSMAAWLEAAQPGKVVLDVGAYTGVYAIAAARQGAQVLAIEPNPTAVRRLKDNAHANNVEMTIVEAAAGELAEIRNLSMKSALSSANSLVKDYGRAVKVSVARLDDMLDLAVPVAAVKMDVEGYEPEALRGAERILRESRPLLITEANTEAARLQQEEILRGFGYGAPRQADGRNLIWRWAE